jgi:hypothetical protein
MSVHVPQNVVHQKAFSLAESTDNRENHDIPVGELWIEEQTLDCHLIVQDVGLVPSRKIQQLNWRCR